MFAEAWIEYMRNDEAFPSPDFYVQADAQKNILKDPFVKSLSKTASKIVGTVGKGVLNQGDAFGNVLGEFTTEACAAMGLKINSDTASMIFTGLVALRNARSWKQLFCGVITMGKGMPIIKDFVDSGIAASHLIKKSLGGPQADNEACRRAWKLRKFNNYALAEAGAHSVGEKASKYGKNMVPFAINPLITSVGFTLDLVKFGAKFIEGKVHKKAVKVGKTNAFEPCPDGYKEFAAFICLKDGCPTLPA